MNEILGFYNTEEKTFQPSCGGEVINEISLADLSVLRSTVMPNLIECALSKKEDVTVYRDWKEDRPNETGVGKYENVYYLSKSKDLYYLDIKGKMRCTYIQGCTFSLQDHLSNTIERVSRSIKYHEDELLKEKANLDKALKYVALQMKGESNE